jgi:hypothetical protein
VFADSACHFVNIHQNAMQVQQTPVMNITQYVRLSSNTRDAARIDTLLFVNTVQCLSMLVIRVRVSVRVNVRV